MPTFLPPLPLKRLVLDAFGISTPPPSLFEILSTPLRGSPNETSVFVCLASLCRFCSFFVLYSVYDVNDK